MSASVTFDDSDAALTGLTQLPEGSEYTMLTPEMVSFSYQLAGPGSRFIAWVVDILITIAIMAALALLFMSICFGMALAGAGAGATAVWALYMVIAFAVKTFYSIYFESRWNGQTPGKRVVGIRVLSDNGVRMNFSQCMIRNLLRFIDNQPVFAYVVGVTSVMLTENSQRLGDVLAGTIVVREKKRAVPEELRLPTSRYNSLLRDPTFASRIIRVLKPAERELLIEIAQRRDDLTLETRAKLFEALANHFKARLRNHLGDIDDSSLSAENWVLSLTQAFLSGEQQNFSK